MIKWNKHLWINGGYAHGLAMILEDIECGKYQIVFASAENVLVKPFFFVNKKKRKKHTVSPDMVCRFASNKLWRVKLRVLLFVLQSIVSFGKKKPSNKLTASILKDCRLENRVQQTSANICDHGEGFVEAILFLGEKNDLTISLIDSTCFFSLQENSATGF